MFTDFTKRTLLRAALHSRTLCDGGSILHLHCPKSSKLKEVEVIKFYLRGMHHKVCAVSGK